MHRDQHKLGNTMTARSSQDRKKVLTIFGNVAYYGQERCNIALLDLLQQTGQVECLLAVNDRGVQWHLQPHLEAANLHYEKMRFCWDIRKTISPRKWFMHLHDIIRSNIEFRTILKRFKPDVIHVANEFQFTTLAPVLLIDRTPVIFHLGDKRYLLNRLIWRYYITTRSTQFVCISDFIREKLLVIRDVSNRLTVIRNNPTDRPVAKAEELPPADPTTFTLLYMGQISTIKGVDLLIEGALSFMPGRHARLLLAGAIDGNPLAQTLIERVKQAGLQEKILFLGMTENIPALLRISHVHVCPSVYEEPLSSVVGEAKLECRPSIVFASGGIPELIRHGIDGHVCPEKSAQSLAEAMKHYYDLPDWGSEQGRNAHDSMQALGITREQFVRSWKKVYAINGRIEANDASH
jgi:glycosyltransferase involved in cell wall biosynthesis